MLYGCNRICSAAPNGRVWGIYLPERDLGICAPPGAPAGQDQKHPFPNWFACWFVFLYFRGCLSCFYRRSALPLSADEPASSCMWLRRSCFCDAMCATCSMQ